MTEEQNNSQDVNIEDLNLDDVVNMDPADLTDTHREYLETNKNYLTSEQQTKFGFSSDEDNSDDDDSDNEEEDQGKKGNKSEDDFDPNKVEPGIKKAITLDLDDEDDDDMDAEDRARINRQVAKGSRSIIERQQLIEDTQAINNIISDNPELKPFKGLALKYMKAHPTLVAEDAMKIASAGHQQKIGAMKEREAAQKAKKTQSGGSSHRSIDTGAKNWATASLEEVEAQIAAAKGQRI